MLGIITEDTYELISTTVHIFLLRVSCGGEVFQ